MTWLSLQSPRRTGERVSGAIEDFEMSPRPPVEPLTLGRALNPPLLRLQGALEEFQRDCLKYGGRGEVGPAGGSGGKERRRRLVQRLGRFFRGEAIRSRLESVSHRCWLAGRPRVKRGEVAPLLDGRA